MEELGLKNTSTIVAQEHKSKKDESAMQIEGIKLSEDDLYTRLKTLQRQQDFISIQEEYVKDEQKNLKRELLRAQEEVKRIKSVPLVIGQFFEMIDTNHGIVGSTTGSNYYVRILSTIDRELLKPSSSVALRTLERSSRCFAS